MSCDLCKTTPALRREWGCDAPTSVPVVSLVCVRCKGKDSSCQRCNGQGEEHIFICPIKEIGNEYPSRILRAYRWLKEYGVFPKEGGWLDQPASLIFSFEIIEDELRAIEKDRQKNDKARIDALRMSARSMKK